MNLKEFCYVFVKKSSWNRRPPKRQRIPIRYWGWKIFKFPKQKTKGMNGWKLLNLEQSEKAVLNDMSKHSLFKLDLIRGSFTLATMRCKQLYVIRVPQRVLVLLYSSSYRPRVCLFFRLVIQNIARLDERHIFLIFYSVGSFLENQSCTSIRPIWFR